MRFSVALTLFGIAATASASLQLARDYDGGYDDSNKNVGSKEGSDNKYANKYDDKSGDNYNNGFSKCAIDNCIPKNYQYGCAAQDYQCYCGKEDFYKYYEQCAKDNCKDNDRDKSRTAMEDKCKSYNMPWPPKKSDY